MKAMNEQDWTDFFYGGIFEEITQVENKIWIVTIEKDPVGSGGSETMFEIDNIRRNELLNANSYLKYEITEKKEINHNISPEGIVTKYDFVHKIIDYKNNLIIIADEKEYEYGGIEDIEEDFD